MYRKTDRKGVTQLCVICPLGITYHISNMTDWPASSLISCQSSILSQQYLTWKRKTINYSFNMLLLCFRTVQCISKSTQHHSVAFNLLLTHICSHFQIEHGQLSLEFDLNIIENCQKGEIFRENKIK